MSLPIYTVQLDGYRPERVVDLGSQASIAKKDRLCSWSWLDSWRADEGHDVTPRYCLPDLALCGPRGGEKGFLSLLAREVKQDVVRPVAEVHEAATRLGVELSALPAVYRPDGAPAKRATRKPQNVSMVVTVLRDMVRAITLGQVEMVYACAADAATMIETLTGERIASPKMWDRSVRGQEV